MGKIGWVVVALAAAWAAPANGQGGAQAVIEIPLRLEDGRMLVTARAADGAEYEFVLGLGMTLLAESGAARIADDLTSLSLGGIPVIADGAQTVPDSELGLDGSAAVGILGGRTFARHDLLIDAPNSRLLVKPAGRSVRWPDQKLSGPVSVAIYHDVLIRTEVEVNGEIFGGLLDLASPVSRANEGVAGRTGLSGGRAESFRMGYAGWADTPMEVVDLPLFRGWDPDGNGFVVIGAPVAYDCAIAVSFFHGEIRTCMR